MKSVIVSLDEEKIDKNVFFNKKGSDYGRGKEPPIGLEDQSCSTFMEITLAPQFLRRFFVFSGTSLVGSLSKPSSHQFLDLSLIGRAGQLGLKFEGIEQRQLDFHADELGRRFLPRVEHCTEALHIVRNLFGPRLALAVLISLVYLQCLFQAKPSSALMSSRSWGRPLSRFMRMRSSRDNTRMRLPKCLIEIDRMWLRS